jgi:hypothetical protein
MGEAADALQPRRTGARTRTAPWPKLEPGSQRRAVEILVRGLAADVVEVAPQQHTARDPRQLRRGAEIEAKAGAQDHLVGGESALARPQHQRARLGLHPFRLDAEHDPHACAHRPLHRMARWRHPGGGDVA